MTWYCCNRCRIAYADDGETPFAERSDFTLSGGNWTWTVSETGTAQHGFWVDVFGDSPLTKCQLTLSLTGGDVTLGWDGDQFLYLNDACIGSAAAFTAGVYRVVLGIGQRYQSDEWHSVVARFMDQDGNLLDEVVVSLWLTGTIPWELAEIVVSDGATYIGVHAAGGVNEPCCTLLPASRCRTFFEPNDAGTAFHYTGAGTLNYLTRVHLLAPLVIDENPTGMLRSVVETETASGSMVFAQIGFGDCCAYWRYYVWFGQDAVYFVVECSGVHHGPVALDQCNFPAAKFYDTEEPVTYEMAVCIQQMVWMGGESSYIRCVVGVGFTDTDGVYYRCTMEGPWLPLYSTPCAADLTGLNAKVKHLQVSDAHCVTGITRAYLDTCWCDYRETDPRVSRCLDILCTQGDPNPPHTPEGWTLEASGLGGVFAVLEGSLGLDCAKDFTRTESTSAEGNQNLGPTDVLDPSWYTPYIDDYLVNDFGLTDYDYEEFCGERFCRDEWLVEGQWYVEIRVVLLVPRRHDDDYQSAGKIPVFALVCVSTGWVSEECPPDSCYSWRRGIMVGESPYPNCDTSVTFISLHWNDQATDTYFRRDPSECCPDPLGIDTNLRLTLTPVMA